MRTSPLLFICLLAFAGTVGAADSPAILSRGFIYERAPFPQCHASTIEGAAGGGLVAAWFGGTRETYPDVGIWV